MGVLPNAGSCVPSRLPRAHAVVPPIMATPRANIPDTFISLPHVGDPGVMLIQGWSGRQLGRMDHDLWCG
jgi:hypothetical protein